MGLRRREKDTEGEKEGSENRMIRHGEKLEDKDGGEKRIRQEEDVKEGRMQRWKQGMKQRIRKCN